jgi:DNA-binding transcriptional MerR regulator
MANGKFYTKEVAKIIGVTPTTIRSYFKDERYVNPHVERRGKQRLLWLDDSGLAKLKQQLEIET